MRATSYPTVAVAILVIAASGAFAEPLTPLETLGKHLFFDTNLSTPPGQSCAACHAPEVGFTGPDAAVNAAGGVYPGAVPGRFGNRKPPASSYAGASPVLHFDEKGEVWSGGMFWDGRATGWTLGDPLAEQALGPFLNPLEQNVASAEEVVRRVSESSYAGLFLDVWGPGSLDPVGDVAGSYERIGRSIAAYERAPEVNPFTSKYDYYLRHEARLTRLERKGLRLFQGKAKCANCHPNRPGPKGEPPLFTDFTYDNLGAPKNPANPFYTAPPEVNPAGAAWVDLGLGGFLAESGYPDEAEENYGKQKVPTLRNVDRRPYPGFVKAFGHNGYFKSLEDLVHFYNTRDVEAWPPPEVPENVNVDELGNLRLSPADEVALVAFLKTLSDGYVPEAASADVDPGGGRAPGGAGGREPALRLVTPNPIRGEAEIAFTLPAPGAVTLTLHDLEGRVVRVLATGSFDAGDHRVAWDGRNDRGARVASGTYFSRLSAAGGHRTQKLIWLN